MQRFDRNHVKEIKKLLFNSYVHDAQLVQIEHNWEEDILIIELQNSIYDVKMKLFFQELALCLSIKSDTINKCKAVNFLILEDDFSYLHKIAPKCNLQDGEALYFMLQLFSGEEYHIVCKAWLMETEKGHCSSPRSKT